MLRAMEIVVAKHMGFCGGVKRAVEMAGGTAEAASGAVYTWGPLIHNPQVVRRFEGAGGPVGGGGGGGAGGGVVGSVRGGGGRPPGVRLTAGGRGVRAGAPPGPPAGPPPGQISG